jgi:hypothetical protein
VSRPDEGLIHTWLDGECTPEESARIDALVASDPAWAAAVAEARGLVAASSRILGALDAVPARVVPQGSRAAPADRARRFRVRPWTGIAAGLVLVAGTVTALRERVGTDVTAMPPQPTISEMPAPTDIPTIGPARVASGGAGVGRASMSGAIVEAERAAETARAQEISRDREQQSRRAVAPPPAAPALAARAPTGFADAAKMLAPNTLAGCWRVSEPPELVGLLREPVIARTAGDTLVLQLAEDRQVTVVRTDDQLRGALTAVRETCPPDDESGR